MREYGLGKRINEVRKDRGMTARRLAEMCHINDVYLREIEALWREMPPGKQELVLAMIRGAAEYHKIAENRKK